MNPDFTSRFLDSVSHAMLKPVYESIIHGDFDRFGDLLADDVEMEIRGAGAMDGTWRGRSQVVEAARINFAQVADQKPEIESIVSEGDSTALLFRESGVFRAAGRDYRARAVQWFRFAGGKVSRIDEIVAFFPE